MLRGGVPFRILKDHLGSVRLVVNATTGVVAQRLSYDEFGRVLEDTAPGFQPFGFAGGLYDHDTGLVCFGARDYDPEIGRWVAKDPIGFDGGLNLYAYCGSDPVNCVDLTGTSPDDYEGSFAQWISHTNSPWVSWLQNDRGLQTAQNVALATANVAATVVLWELAIPRLLATAAGAGVATASVGAAGRIAAGSAVAVRATPALLPAVTSTTSAAIQTRHLPEVSSSRNTLCFGWLLGKHTSALQVCRWPCGRVSAFSIRRTAPSSTS